MTVKTIKHGTYKGFQQCRRAGDPCDSCRAASAEYQRNYRKKNPDKARADKEESLIRAKAKTILGQRHPEELKSIIRVLKGQG